MNGIMNGRNCGYRFLLLLLCGGVMVVFGNALFGNAKAPLREPASFSFPSQVPLDSGHLLDSQALAPQVLWNSKVASGWRYRYQYAGKPLNIELRYVLDVENSQQDLPQMFKMMTQIPPKLVESSTIRYRPEVGFYSLFTDQKTDYLSACINPRGGSTVTGKQFQQNRLLHDLRINRLLPWILGQNRLIDHRCLWTMLSLPKDRLALDARGQILENAGVAWLSWWQVHFPND
jgi:cyanosortase A-associated protein